MGQEKKYLVLFLEDKKTDFKQGKTYYNVIGFDTLKQAVGFVMRENKVTTSKILKVIDDFNVVPIYEDDKGS